MSFTVNLSGGGLLINRFNSSNMLKSTQEKLQRQQERDNKVAFFEAQKENLKNRKADSLEEISEKLEEEGLVVTVHGKGSFIAAANQEYNNSQMFHVMDEAEEHGEKIAEAAERNKPKTEEERKEEMVDEALGTEENKGMMSEIMDELSETTEEMTEQMTEKTVENMEELPDEVLQEQLATDSLEAAEMVQTDTIKRYVSIDIRV
mgnify:CR=1 FL=1